MENLYFTVIPAKAGIHWLQELRDPRLRGDDSKLVFFDTLLRERARVRVAQKFPLIVRTGTWVTL
jgi:hypothetical protein